MGPQCHLKLDWGKICFQTHTVVGSIQFSWVVRLRDPVSVVNWFDMISHLLVYDLSEILLSLVYGKDKKCL